MPDTGDPCGSAVRRFFQETRQFIDALIGPQFLRGLTLAEAAVDEVMRAEAARRSGALRVGAAQPPAASAAQTVKKRGADYDAAQALTTKLLQEKRLKRPARRKVGRPQPP